MDLTTLRPGLLVSVKTSITGNVKYITKDLERDHLTPEGEKLARWETERTIKDPAEHDAAVAARSLARSKVQSVCAQSAFGLLCPEVMQDKLDAAVAEARTITEAFNRGASLTRLNFYVIAGRISPDDVEAVRAINSEVTELMAKMAEGLGNLDVKAVRDAANRARSLGSMLSDDAKDRVKGAIDIARKAARDIVTAGETGAAEIDRAAIARISEARAAFLDLDEAAPVGEVMHTAAALDLEPEAQAAEAIAEALDESDENAMQAIDNIAADVPEQVTEEAEEDDAEEAKRIYLESLNRKPDLDLDDAPEVKAAPAQVSMFDL